MTSTASPAHVHYSQRQNDLERDIFGGSDSELSSDEEEELQRTLPSAVSRRSPPADDYQSSAGDSGDEYVQESKGAPTIKKPSRRSSQHEPRKRKRKVVQEVNIDDLPPEQASKLRLERQIEAILKPKKTARPKKRKKDDEEVLDRVADEQVSRLREAMLAAADEDQQANVEKIPAMAKLKLLPQVMEVLRKASLAQSIVDNNLLEGVRRWLEPLPDRSLPALNIQREFFPSLKKMEYIDSAVLKESGLGRIVLFYTKCKRVNPDVAKLADELVSAWSRPIIKRSASYRDRVIPVARNMDENGSGSVPRAGERLNAILARAKEKEKNRVRKNAVMIPQQELGNYTVAPKDGLARSNLSVDVDIERRRKNAERLRNLTRKINMKG